MTNKVHFTDLQKTETTDSEEKSSQQNSELAADQSELKPVDPTRYGDWELKGRCIDF